MSYFNCRQSDPCEDCNGYVGPLDTYACQCRCHNEPTYDLGSRTWTGTCPCIEAGQRDPECAWHGRQEQAR